MATLQRGYYNFVSTLSFVGITDETVNINFSCNEQTFSSLTIDISGDIVEFGAFTVYDISTNTWSDDNYKLIYIGVDTTVSANIELFFQLNAVYGYTVTYNSLGGTSVSAIYNTSYITSLPTITKNGFDFLGWYYDTAFSQQATLGDLIDHDVTLYAKWKFTGVMTIVFYNYINEDKRVDKTTYLRNAYSIQGYLINSTSIVDMVVNIELDDVFAFNYCYISAFNRYYFVGDVININNKLWQLTLKCDVLMSYKDTILDQNAFIERQEFDYNDDLVDSRIVRENDNNIEIININTSGYIASSSTDTRRFILEVGGKVGNE